jgi:hypothetical protein
MSPLHLSADHPLLRVQKIGLAVGVVALAACGAGWIFSPDQFFRSYLIAYLFWIGVALGCLPILMLQYITGGLWGAALRRVLESGTRTIPVMAVLFLPIVLGLHHLYEWTHADLVAQDPVLQYKSFYLNVPFFLARAALYFAVWMAVIFFLNRWSSEQDAHDDPSLGKRLHYLSRGGLLLYALTMTFASIDWAMSLEPHWYSTIYGILFIGGQVLSAFAFAIPVTALMADREPLSEILTPGVFQDLGKLLLAFIMLWAYFNFSQFIITWSGNLPEEIPWYLKRSGTGWQAIAIALVVLHFALPFFILLSRDLKRNRRRLAMVALVVLFLRFVDVYWMIAPAFSPGVFTVHWMDLLAVVGLGGLWLYFFVGQLQGRPLMPLNDPAFNEA